MENLTDEELMVAFRSGDHHAFQVLYDRYKNRLFRFILNTYEKDPVSAEDCLEDVFIKVIKGKNNFIESMRFSTWVYTICRNVCLNRIRSRSRGIRFELLEEDIPCRETATAGVVTLEMEEIIRNAVAGLSEDQRMIFIMRALDEMSYREISAILGLNAGNVRVVFNRAKKKLQAAIKPYLEEP